MKTPMPEPAALRRSELAREQRPQRSRSRASSLLQGASADRGEICP
ncbi:hypothetical protein PCLA_06r0381 [Pseudomonas citronellolis]|nr:hypothetical protein PCLA_06r0381 [Pseudomonas citronellolis]